ncbi:DeoR/GlpR family DNA-binding transcription regulator [Sporosarcina sp. 179-K 3D1 HS]|uniref:DeoR/GlpR family DNA-binding transcription regulator n=1 Tax=Sporosarcina sp. 179-K 3D1 HS TaxID=3232169 RepID=UPI00399F2F6D
MSLASIERKRKILDLLEGTGKVKVKDLASHLNVSTETIRKYLDDLEGENKLKKVYGGAISLTFFNQEPPTAEREIINKEGKEKIGELACTLIHDEDVIAIDEGTTPLYLSKSLKNKKNITIVTPSINSLNVLMELIQQNVFTGKIILIGGQVDVFHQRLVGEHTLEMMNNIFVDKNFIAADGLSIKDGVTSYDLSKGMVTKKLIEHANQTILLIDHTKLNTRTHFKMASLHNIDTIICDKKYPVEWENSLIEAGVQWITIDD